MWTWYEKIKGWRKILLESKFWIITSKSLGKKKNLKSAAQSYNQGARKQTKQIYTLEEKNNKSQSWNKELENPEYFSK